jgi:hypothetical protein
MGYTWWLLFVGLVVGCHGQPLLPHGVNVSSLNAGDSFGSSILVSGSLLVVGADGTSNSAGSAYIFNCTTSGDCSRLQNLSASSFDTFASCTATSGDGSVLAICAPGHSGSKGAVYLFDCSASGCGGSPHVLSTSFSSNSGDLFGSAVSLNGAGTLLAVGAYGRSGQRGSTYVFSCSAGICANQNSVSVSGLSSGDEFGYQVALSFTGGILAIGAPGNGGVVYVCTCSSVNCINCNPILSSPSSGNDLLGSSLSVAAISRGYLFAIGARGFRGNTGAVQLCTYTTSPTSWTCNSNVTAAGRGTSGDLFGFAVSLSSDGALLAVGAPGASRNGAVYTFSCNGANCGYQQLLNASTISSGVSSFGSSVAAGRDNSTLSVGAPGSSDMTGAAFFFSRVPPTPSTPPFTSFTQSATPSMSPVRTRNKLSFCHRDGTVLSLSSGRRAPVTSFQVLEPHQLVKTQVLLVSQSD